jgi:hypothetical protein
MKDALETFCDKFLKNSSLIGRVPLFNAVHKVEDVMSVTWYREKQFQVQLFVVPPNYIIPEHTHPNVDSFELYVGGEIQFTINGKYTTSEEAMTTPNPDSTSYCRGVRMRVKPETTHGAIIGPSGGVFMSIQHWLNGVEPHCVAADYTGITMGEHHLSTVKHGDAYVKENLTTQDAASLEAA